ncbi:hypothetical protein [Flavobacterium aquicola]|uniref:Uncharacterized protein n=1 Tax=Flavobacterium aquicola TaxID=1682742 RepID=A0A3E0E3P6_9FLAO|nr:hypothetical protein [Flavobacterium aquicola]REG92914.1 hypothetical protein C8P67_1149 [Flavobacterium aquicola]
MKNKEKHFSINVKNILSYFLIIMLSILSISCDKGDSDDNDNNNSGQTPSAGTAAIILTAGGQEFKIAGPCGWANAAGANYIGANQSDNNLRTFSSYFNITQLPEKTTTYTLVEDSSDTDPAHITMNITEISGTTLIEWSSKNTSGNLTLVVDGNKITADLAGITLYPQTDSGFFTNGNTGNFANNGVLTGTLTFYRQ